MFAKALLLIAAVLALLPPSAASSGKEAVFSSRGLGPVAPLNRRTFAGNVLTGDRVDHWVVLFCVDWYSACEEALSSYMSLAEEHSRSLNQGSVLRDVVRFASVDCAVDKVLCNEQSVEDYPTVAHYKGGKRVAAKAGSRGSLAKWLQKELPSGDLVGESQAQPWLTDAERSLALRALASFAALLALFVWAVGHGADLWLARTMMRELPYPEKATQREHEVSRQAVPADVPVAAVPTSGGVTRRLPQDWARERDGLVL